MYLLPFLDQRCAVFCGSDCMAFGVVTEARMHGIAVPEQLAVCGFGNMELSEMNEPPITTVSLEGRRHRPVSGGVPAAAAGGRGASRRRPGAGAVPHTSARDDLRLAAAGWLVPGWLGWSWLSWGWLGGAGAIFAASRRIRPREVMQHEKTPVCPPCRCLLPWPAASPAQPSCGRPPPPR